MTVRRAQHGGIRHPRQLYVVGEATSAGQHAGVFASQNGLADEIDVFGLSDSGICGDVHVASTTGRSSVCWSFAAKSTASTIF